MREGINPSVDEGRNKSPTGSAAFERSLSGMRGMERHQLGKEKIWYPERSFLTLWKEGVLNTTIKGSLVKNSVLRQSTLRLLFLIYNACAKSIHRPKGLSSPNEPFSQQSRRRRNICHSNINVPYDIRKQISWFGGLGHVGSILISAIQITCFFPLPCPLLEKIARQIGSNSKMPDKAVTSCKRLFSSRALIQ